MRLKQICNHPSQWLGDNAWAEEDSGKFAPAARDHRGDRGAAGEGAGLHPVPRDDGAAGGIPRLRVRPGRARAARRDRGQEAQGSGAPFQEDEDVPFFVLSVKAGGAGLNLTAASHVIHFDRWWNPAVENQATDRAFRIGQTKNVLVHKFVCRGTVEDKIDQHDRGEAASSPAIFSSGGAETLLTEMKDDELLKLVALDLAAAMKEG